MKLYHKLIVLLVPIIALCTVVKATNIVVNIRGQGLTIGTPANIQLENFSSSREVSFNDYFWIDDLRGSKIGHYTSIQGVVYGSDGEIISGATVGFKTNSENIVLLGGVADNADFNRNFASSSYTDITEPKLLFYRNDNPNHSGRLNKYGFKPTIKVSVPSGSSSSYTVRLSYTLYDMPTDIISQ